MTEVKFFTFESDPEMYVQFRDGEPKFAGMNDEGETIEVDFAHGAMRVSLDGEFLADVPYLDFRVATGMERCLRGSFAERILSAARRSANHTRIKILRESVADAVLRVRAESSAEICEIVDVSMRDARFMDKLQETLVGYASERARNSSVLVSTSELRGLFKHLTGRDAAEVIQKIMGHLGFRFIKDMDSFLLGGHV